MVRVHWLNDNSHIFIEQQNDNQTTKLCEKSIQGDFKTYVNNIVALFS